jgi:hypothetical protein
MKFSPNAFLRAALVPLIAAFLLAPAMADTLYLENGDVLSGDFLGLEGGKIRFTPPYTGELQIDAAALHYLVSDGPVVVTLQDGRTLEGALFVTDDTQMMETSAGLVVLAPGEISSILLPGAAPAEAPPAEEAPAEAPAEEEKPKLWSGHVESGLALRSGSTDRVDLSLNTALVRKTDRHVLSLSFNAAYAEVEDVINTRLYKGEAKWQYYPRERLYLYWLVGGESDDARKLDLRLNTAVGVGYDFIKQEKRTWSADIGVDYAYDRWNPFTPEERDREKEAQRAAAYAQFQNFVDQLQGGISLDQDFLRQAWRSVLLFRDPLALYDEKEEYHLSLRAGTVFTQTLFEKGKLSETLVIYPSIDEIGDFRATSDFAFTTPLTEQLGLKVNLLTEYDSIADEVGADAWQNTLTTGLRYEF